jgi:hypothetical protein
MRVVLSIVVVAAGSAACSSGPTCASSDADCILGHLTITVPSWNGSLTRIAAGTVQPAQLVAGKGAPALADSLGAPSLCFSPTDTVIGLPFTFTDPNGARPGGCFSVRSSATPPGPFGGFPMAAFPSLPDGQTSGRLSMLIEPSLQAGDDGNDFVLDLYPVAAAKPGDEAIAQLQGGGQVVVGQPISMPTHVIPSGSCYGNSGDSCPDGHPCSGSDHICCKQSDGSYLCLLPGLCR